MFDKHKGNTSTLAVVMVVIVLGLIVLWLVNSNDDTVPAESTTQTTSDTSVTQ